MEVNGVIRKIRSGDISPLDYDELVKSWNSLCEMAYEEDAEFQFTGIESAALAALSDQSDSTRTREIDNQISRMLNSFEYPTYLVTADGRIAAANTAASLEFDLAIGDCVDQLPYTLDEPEEISSLIKKCIDSARKTDIDAILRRAHIASDEKDATIALTASIGRVPMVLVFIVTTKWMPALSTVLMRQFGLTHAEIEVLVSFINGYSTQAIAKQRGRSYATVRTQFQSILHKTDTCNQSDLLRMVLSFSSFSKSIGEIVDAVTHPHRRRAEILREGGRIVEVTLMGDLLGDPILTIANAANYTFNAEIEQAFAAAGLYLISVCTPGCGKTDPAPRNEARQEYLAGDVSAVLDQLGIGRCLIMAYNANSPVCYRLANRIKERIYAVAHVAGVIPIRFVETTATQSSWSNAILKAGVKHPSMQRMLLLGAMKAWQAIGAKQFNRLQMASNPIDSECMLSPDNVREYEHALKTATQAGIVAASDDMSQNFEDWTTEVEALPVPISMMHGVEDKLFVIEHIRQFAATFPDKIELTEIPNAGMPLMQSHTSKVVELLRSVVDKEPMLLRSSIEVVSHSLPN